MTTGFSYVLIADDDPEDIEFFCSGMHRVFPAINVFKFECGEKLLAYLGDPILPIPPSLILIDYKMPPLNAPQILMAIEAEFRYSQTPKIVWSTSERRKERDECLALGASRFVVKPATDCELDLFINSLECWIVKSPRLGTSADDNIISLRG